MTTPHNEPPRRGVEDFRQQYMRTPSPLPPPGPASAPAPGPAPSPQYAPQQDQQQQQFTPSPFTANPLQEVDEFAPVQSTSAQKQLATTGFAGWMNRTFKTSFPRRESELDHDRFVALINEMIRYAQVVGVVSGGKGGSGKTTFTQALGSTISHYRNSGAAVGVDIDSNSTLAMRTATAAQPNTYSSVTRMGADPNLNSSSDVNSHLIFNPNNFAVLPGPEYTHEHDNRVYPRHVLHDLRALNKTHTLMLLDFPGQISEGIGYTAIDWIDFLVYIVDLEPGALSVAKNDLRRIARRRPDLMTNAVVILNHQSPGKSFIEDEERHVADIQNLSNNGDSSGITVFEVHHDPHLAKGKPVRMDQTDPATRERFLEIAATIIKKLPKTTPRFFSIDPNSLP